MRITESKLRKIVREELIKELFDEDSPVIKMLQGDEGEEIAPQMMQAVEFLNKIEDEHGVDKDDIEDIEKTGVIDLLMKKR